MRGRVSRRRFVRTGAMALGASVVTGPLQALQLRAATRPLTISLPLDDRLGYGPLAPVRDETTGLELLELPQGFRYVSFGWAGSTMSDGIDTPTLHDGMAAFEGPAGTVRLVRNHELNTNRGSFAPPSISYDTAAGGGTTTLVFDPVSETCTDSWASLGGTIRNCAGGPTPWGSWLTCEESVARGGRLRQQHGFVFEVPADGIASPIPLTDMGRFVHEAVAVDPRTGVVYETEDRSTGGFYRFIPHVPGSLHQGGRLQMLAIDGAPRFDTRRNQRLDIRRSVSWVDIEDPLNSGFDGSGVFRQGFELGGAVFARCEGCWFGNGMVYIVCTSGGNAGQGQVWELDPLRDKLRLVFESPRSSVSDNPDNICVSPRGGLVLCADGGRPIRLQGLSPDGRIFDFARNNVRLLTPVNGFIGDYRGSEFAGATFSPDGKWLFFNVHRPGITIAITGPWENGIL